MSQHPKKTQIYKVRIKSSHCNQVFTQNSTYRRHRKALSKQLNGCQYCEKWFFELNHLVHHEKRHNQEKEYKCGYCDYRAVTKAEVKSSFFCTQ